LFQLKLWGVESCRSALSHRCQFHRTFLPQVSARPHGRCSGGGSENSGCREPAHAFPRWWRSPTGLEKSTPLQIPVARNWGALTPASAPQLGDFFPGGLRGERAGGVCEVELPERREDSFVARG